MFPLLLDANNLIKRSVMASALDDLKAGETWTGGVYATLTSLTALVAFLAAQDSRPDTIVAVFDDGVPAFRKKAIPSYKENRKSRLAAMTEEQVEKCFQQVPLARQVLELLGCTTISRKDWEADDLIGAYALATAQTKTPVLIASSDKDLWQCVQYPTCGVWDLGKKGLVDSQSYGEFFEKAYDAPPVPLPWYSVFRAICGDASDGVPGVHGVGPKGAAKVILSVPDGSDIVSIADQVSALHEVIGHEPEKKLMQVLKSKLGYVRQVAEVNAICVPRAKLPLAEFSTFPKHKKVDRHAFLKFCKSLAFRSVLGDPDRFLKHFEAMGAA